MKLFLLFTSKNDDTFENESDIEYAKNLHKNESKIEIDDNYQNETSEKIKLKQLM